MTARTPYQPAFRRFRFATPIAALLTLATAAVPASGQGPPQQAPVAQTAPIRKQGFEVASIRPVDPHVPLDFGKAPSFPSNRLTYRIVNVKGLINVAFGVVGDEISGGPDWIDSQLYSIDAKVEGDALLTQKQMRPLLQSLLEERFHLKVHREQKVALGYALVLAKGGSKLQPTKGGPALTAASGFELRLQNGTVEDLANTMWAWTIKKPVVDRTGLEGMYDFDLKFMPQDGPLYDDPRYSNLPDIFTATQEQLGLKLVPQKVPVDYLVIDHVEPPSEN